MKTLRRHTSRNGFTLIEVMVAIMVLTFVAVFTSQSLQNTLKFKTRFQVDVDQQSQLKSAMLVIERDINLAFHHRDVISQLYREAKREAAQGPSPSPSPGAPSPSIQPTPTAPPNPNSSAAALDTEDAEKPPLTQFVGTEHTIDFSSRSNVRMQMDQAESDQAEIGYELKPCGHLASMQTKGVTPDCIWRRVSPYIDDDITKGGTSNVLLEGVTEFKLRYFGEGKTEWTNTWRTDQGGDAATQSTFPLAVEVTITTEQNGRKATLQTVAAVRFPNNPDKKKGATSP